MKLMRFFLIYLFFILLFNSCKQNDARQKSEPVSQDQIDVVEEWIEPDTIIIDSNLSFNEAMDGSNAPQSVTDELELIEVTYTSTDGKLHQGQILTNKKIASDLKELFRFMLEQDFVIEKAIPIVAYNWSDSLSMADNNSYSFCYRNITYSKHALGLAIDINPRFNPLRWKKTNRPNEPIGAVLDTTVNGTLHPEHPVVKEFRKRGFRWGHTFSKYWDDHHFEKR